MTQRLHSVNALLLYSATTPCCLDATKVIAFLSQKGGSGKTTLAVHTAVAAEESGERVAVIDTDMQKSATTWKQARTGETSAVVTAAPTQLLEVIAAARDDAMTLCIVDTAPHAAPDTVRITALADLIVIPCRPTAFDLAAAGAAVEIVRAVSAKAVFVLSTCPFRAPEIAETGLCCSISACRSRSPKSLTAALSRGRWLRVEQ